MRGELDARARRARAAARDRQRRRQPRLDRAHRAAEARAAGPRASSRRTRACAKSSPCSSSMLVSEERHTQTLVDLPLQGRARRAAGRIPLPAAAAHADRPARARLQRPARAGGQPAGRGAECYDVFPGARRMPQRPHFRLAFKYFRRVEGTFRVNPKAKVESVQVRVYETGSQPAARHALGELCREAREREKQDVQQDEQAAEPDRQPDRRDHAHRGQRDFQRRTARGRHGARQRRRAARPAGHAGGLVGRAHRRRGAGRAHRGQRHHQRAGARHRDARTTGGLAGSKGMCTTRASRSTRARSSRAAWCITPPR